MTNNLLTIPQAAIARGVSQSRIRYWIKRDWLAGVRKYGRWLVDKDELLAFEPPSVGWPRGVGRCRVCRGAMVEGHECTEKENDDR